jgi:hypothetical protein
MHGNFWITLYNAEFKNSIKLCNDDVERTREESDVAAEYEL